MPRPKGKRTIPESMFVRAWNMSASSTEAARSLGLAPGSARCRAAALRKRGLALKKFRTGRPVVAAPAEASHAA